MIEIDNKNKKIRLINESKEEILKFPLLMGYICPECEKIILAYWVDNNILYNIFEYLPEDPEYKSFKANGGMGIEMKSHECSSIYINLNMICNVWEYISDLKYSYEDKIKEITMPNIPNEKIKAYLNDYNARYIDDICGNEGSMLILDSEGVKGKSAVSETWEMRRKREDQRIKKFLKFFGIDFEEFNK